MSQPSESGYQAAPRPSAERFRNVEMFLFGVLDVEDPSSLASVLSPAIQLLAADDEASATHLFDNHQLAIKVAETMMVFPSFEAALKRAAPKTAAEAMDSLPRDRGISLATMLLHRMALWQLRGEDAMAVVQHVAHLFSMDDREAMFELRHDRPMARYLGMWLAQDDDAYQAFKASAPKAEAVVGAAMRDTGGLDLS